MKLVQDYGGIQEDLISHSKIKNFNLLYGCQIIFWQPFFMAFAIYLDKSL
jgi:hypothetical protein